MKSGLFTGAIQLFTMEALENMIVKTGETSGHVQHALEHIIPILLKRFATRTAEHLETADRFLKIARKRNNHGPWKQISSFFNQATAAYREKQILEGLFDSRDEIRLIAMDIAQKAYVKQSSAAMLMYTAAPLCLSAIDKYAIEQDINPGRLASWVANQKLGFEKTAPPRPDPTSSSDNL